MKGKWRKTERLINGAWVECELEDLHKGDIFRLTGEPHRARDPRGNFGIEADRIDPAEG